MMVRNHAAVVPIVLFIFVSASAAPGASGEEFTHLCSWTAYDPGEHGIGRNLDGYYGGAFDGRYIYFAPGQNSLGYHGTVLRYDTQGAFEGASSWSAFDAGVAGIGNDPAGYQEAIFDGRYVYFVPRMRAGGYHGEVLRYDTAGVFTDVSSWAAYDPGDHGVGQDPDGYVGGAFDGRYVYFAPYHNGTRQHGEVLRLDTTGSFTDSSSWTTYDAGQHGVGTKYGYVGAVFDGRYVYFVPNCTSDTTHHGEVRRYDTTAEFTESSSWSAYDYGDHCGTACQDPDGYVGGVFDGRYVYFVPTYNDPTWHGEVLRLDTTGEFTSVTSWMTFDPGSHGLGTDPDGYAGASFDGRYVYFAPVFNGTRFHSEILRYDTAGEFPDISAWSIFDPSVYGTNNGIGGYMGTVFDGRHVYFTPTNWTFPHGEILRFSTLGCLGDFDLDLDIDPDDAAAFMLCWDPGQPVAGECDIGDFDGDEDVDCNDWNHFKYAWTGPPACPPAFLECEIDCNSNGFADEFEATNGVGIDCQPNSTPDDCDVNPTDPDGNGEVSGDDNTDGIPDECQCTLPAAPSAETALPDTGFGRRVRYLSFRAGTSGNQEALRVTFVDMPASPPAYDFRYAIGWKMWIGQPQRVSEVSGKPDDTPPTFWAAMLQCTPYFTDWSVYEWVHVYGMEIVPRATCEVQAVGQGCENAESMFSTALSVDMSAWGNVVGSSNQQPPNAMVDFNDISSVVDKFKNLPAAPSKSRADVAPGVPDRIVDFTDIPSVVDAFRGRPYPYAGPQPCP